MALYTVRSGDTLAKIAAQFGTSVQAIAQTNYIQNVNAIRVGQVLSMPNDKSSSSSVAQYFQKIDRLTRAPADTKTSYPNLGNKVWVVDPANPKMMVVVDAAPDANGDLVPVDPRYNVKTGINNNPASGNNNNPAMDNSTIYLIAGGALLLLLLMKKSH